MSHDLFLDLPRLGPGSDATTRHLLDLADPHRRARRIVDLGCGTGASVRVLARETTARITAVDLHRPFLQRLLDRTPQAHALAVPLDALPLPDGGSDLVWSEGAAYVLGFGRALASWRRLLAPGGTLVVTEIELVTDRPADAVRDFWADRYPLRTTAENRRIAEDAGYTVVHRLPLPEGDWWDEYYGHLPGDVDEFRAEIELRRDHGGDYRYAGYVLRPRHEHVPWSTRRERPEDRATVRAVNLAAFPTAGEADLVDALRADADAWVDLSFVATDEGRVVGHALLTRCHVGGAPALALAPCAVLPSHQGRGAGAAAIRAALEAARDAGENLVVVLGHADYYPRFGFAPASAVGVRAPFDVPDEAFLTLALDASRPVPTGTIAYPPAFGV